jgi:hypothetical protein
LNAYRKRNERRLSKEVVAQLIRCEETVAREEIDYGFRLFGALIPHLPLWSVSRARSVILQECATQLTASGSEHTEYILLAIHALMVER